jgi:GNAT superfamily N-acetyltransferase
VPEDASRLTEIAVAAATREGDSGEIVRRWREELAFHRDQFDTSDVFCAELDGVVVGMCAVRCWGDDSELEALWVLPEHSGRGVGSSLFALAQRVARDGGATQMRIAADLEAEPFYRRRGAWRTGQVPSRPDGRVRALLRLAL